MLGVTSGDKVFVEPSFNVLPTEWVDAVVVDVPKRGGDADSEDVEEKGDDEDDTEECICAINESFICITEVKLLIAVVLAVLVVTLVLILFVFQLKVLFLIKLVLFWFNNICWFCSFIGSWLLKVEKELVVLLLLLPWLKLVLSVAELAFKFLKLFLFIGAVFGRWNVFWLFDVICGCGTVVAVVALIARI